MGLLDRFLPADIDSLWVGRLLQVLHLRPRSVAPVGEDWAGPRARAIRDAAARRSAPRAVQRQWQRSLSEVNRYGDPHQQVVSLYALASQLEAGLAENQLLRDTWVNNLDGWVMAHPATDSVAALRLRGLLARKRASRPPAARTPRATPSLSRANDALTAWLRRHDDSAMLALAGREYLSAQQIDLAERCLQRAEASGDCPVAETAPLLGQCAFARDDLESASAHFDRAVQAGCSESEVATWQAVALLEQRRYAEASHYADRLPAAGGDSSRAWLIGTIELGLGHVEQAQQHLALVPLDHQHGREARYGGAVCGALRGDADAAEAGFRSLALVDADDGLGALGLGLLAADNGAAANAFNLLGAALARHPGHRAARLRLGETCFAQGQHAQAAALLDQARQAGVTGPATTARIGLAHLVSGELRAAYEELAALCMAGDGPDLSGHALACASRIASSAVAVGNYADAVGTLETAQGIGKLDEAMQQVLARSLYEQGRRALLDSGSITTAQALFARARAVCEIAESRLAELLMRVSAGEPFDHLLPAASSEPGAGPFGDLARLLGWYRAGRFDEVSALLERLDTMDPPFEQVRRLVEFHVLVRTRQDSAALAPQQVQAFVVALSDARFQQAAGPASALGTLVVALLFHAQDRRRPRPHLVRAELQRLFPEDSTAPSWQLAHGLARVLEASRAPAKDRLDLLQAARKLLDRCGASGDAAVWLAAARRAAVGEHLAQDQFGPALALMGEELAAGTASVAMQQVHAALTGLLAGNSPASARLAARAGELRRARAIWTELAQGGDAAMAHQIAVSLLSEAIDFAARDPDRACRLTIESLVFWKQVADSNDWWSVQSGKLAKLGSNLFPFARAPIDAARSGIARQVLLVLCRLAEQCVQRDDIAGAKRCVEAIAGSPFGNQPGRELLEAEFGARLVAGPAADPSLEASLEAALARAERVLACDPPNRTALVFAMETCSSERDILWKQDKDRPPHQAMERFRRTARHASRLNAAELRGDPLQGGATVSTRNFWRVFGDTIDFALIAHAQPLRQAHDKSVLPQMRTLLDAHHRIYAPACREWGLEVDDDIAKKISTELRAYSASGAHTTGAEWLASSSRHPIATATDGSYTSAISIFGKPSVNPFRINAFTIVGISSRLIEPRALRDALKSRRDEVEHTASAVTIDGGHGVAWAVEVHHVNDSEEPLLNPSRRCVEELLAPGDPALAEIAGLRDLQDECRLKPVVVESWLSLEPIDLSHLLVHRLPAARFDPPAAPAPMPPMPPLDLEPLAPGDWLVTRKDGRHALRH